MAPFAGEVAVDGQDLVLSSPGLTLFLSGMEACVTGTVSAGEPLGAVAGRQPSLRIQLCRIAGLVPPRYATPAQAQAWASPLPLAVACSGREC